MPRKMQCRKMCARIVCLCKWWWCFCESKHTDYEFLWSRSYFAKLAHKTSSNWLMILDSIRKKTHTFFSPNNQYKCEQQICCVFIAIKIKKRNFVEIVSFWYDALNAFANIEMNLLLLLLTSKAAINRSHNQKYSSKKHHAMDIKRLQ